MRGDVWTLMSRAVKGRAHTGQPPKWKTRFVNGSVRLIEFFVSGLASTFFAHRATNDLPSMEAGWHRLIASLRDHISPESAWPGPSPGPSPRPPPPHLPPPRRGLVGAGDICCTDPEDAPPRAEHYVLPSATSPVKFGGPSEVEARRRQTPPCLHKMTRPQDGWLAPQNTQLV